MQYVYKYCAYWGTWNRLLHGYGFNNREDGQIVELDLTPVNGDSGDWAGVKRGRIRHHQTALHTRDKLVKELPPEIQDWMASRIGISRTIDLCEGDWEFMPLGENS